MFEQLGLIGTIRDEEESPEEPDTDSDQEVSVSGDTTRPEPEPADEPANEPPVIQEVWKSPTVCINIWETADPYIHVHSWIH